MPTYEFRCEECGTRFEDLVPVGTQSIPCPQCSSERTVRAFSSPPGSLRLVKSRSAQRMQEAKNAELNRSSKAKFKETMRKVRESRGPRGGSPPGAA